MLARDPSAKAIVFSQFTSFLDLISFRLQQAPVSLFPCTLATICTRELYLYGSTWSMSNGRAYNGLNCYRWEDMGDGVEQSGAQYDSL